MSNITEQKEVKNPSASFVCPDCGGDVFLERNEYGNYHPDYGSTYEVDEYVCENNPDECDFSKRRDPEDEYCDMTGATEGDR